MSAMYFESYLLSNCKDHVPATLMSGKRFYREAADSSARLIRLFNMIGTR
jgi:hypothetical protein